MDLGESKKSILAKYWQAVPKGNAIQISYSLSPDSQDLFLLHNDLQIA